MFIFPKFITNFNVDFYLQKKNEMINFFLPSFLLHCQKIKLRMMIRYQKIYNILVIQHMVGIHPEHYILFVQKEDVNQVHLVVVVIQLAKILLLFVVVVINIVIIHNNVFVHNDHVYPVIVTVLVKKDQEYVFVFVFVWIIDFN